MPSTSASPNAIEIFFCYASKDEALQAELETHLSIFKRQGLIRGWNKRKINGGGEWTHEISGYVNTAQIILLLVSRDFMVSDYCTGIEMKRALERNETGEARVIPIILRPVDWKSTPFGKLPVLPTNGIPIKRWQDSDEAFLNVARGIRDIIKDFTNKSLMGSTYDSGTALLDSITEPVAPIVWNAPSPLHPFFTDRDEALDELYTTLTRGTQLPVAIIGPEGIGKTQLALKYAYHYNKDYQAILWAKADLRPVLIADFVAIAGLLNLPEKDEQNHDRAITAVKGWLEDHTDWLLIFDNVNNLSVVSDFLPLASKGHLLLTTRKLSTGKIVKRVKVAKLAPYDAVEFLLYRAQITAQDEPIWAGAEEIVDVLDGLPFALDLAGAYIKETKCGLDRYLDHYRRQSTDHREAAFDYPASITANWNLVFETIQRTNPSAIALLALCAFFYPDIISEELLTEGLKELSRTYKPLALTSSELDTILNTLLAFSLIGHASKAKTFTIPRLLQDLLRDSMDKETQHQWIERTVRIINSIFPYVEISTWGLCEQYLPHAYLCAEYIKQWSIVIPEAVQLLNRMASYLKVRGQYSQAELLSIQALDLHEQVWGPNDPDVGQSLNTLAGIYHAQGKYSQAEPLYERELAVYRRALGSSHPSIAECLSNLATLYNDQGRYVEAEVFFKQVLMIREKSLGQNHPDTASSMNSLALLYYTQGKYEEAEPLFQKALAIRRKALGQDHLSADVATSLNNLAALYNYQGEFEKAKQLFREALAIDEKVLGPNHPNVARDYSNLGGVLETQGDLTKAQMYYQRALSIDEKTYGPYHPLIAVDISNLASILQKQGDLPGARELYERALSIEAKAYGPAHLNVATRLNNVGSVLQEQGYLEEARTYYEQALRIVEAAYGQNHPHVASILNNLASALVEDLPRAQALYEKALTIAQATYGSSHLQVGHILNNLANVLQKMGDTAGAQSYYEEALEIFQKHFGRNYPTVLQIEEKLRILSAITGEPR